MWSCLANEILIHRKILHRFGCLNLNQTLITQSHLLCASCSMATGGHWRLRDHRSRRSLFFLLFPQAKMIREKEIDGR